MDNITDLVGNVVDTVSTTAKVNFSSIVQTIFLILLCFLAYKIANVVFHKYISKYIKLLPVEKNVTIILNKVTTIIIVFIAIILIANALGINTSSIIALFSIFGLAISLSVQNTMSNIANAILLYFNNPFSVGDYIEGAGFEGTILDVGFTYTKLMALSNDIIYVPNNVIAASTITNTSMPKERQLDHKIVIDYNEDFDKVRSVILSVINDEEKVVKTSPIYVVIVDYLSYGYQIKIVCSALNDDFYPCSFSLLEKYKKALDNANIKIATLMRKPTNT